MSGKALWSPSSDRIEGEVLSRFSKQYLGVGGDDYDTIHRWSVEQPAEFWKAVWEFSQIVASETGESVLENPDALPGAKWFAGARLNYAENLLAPRGEGDGDGITWTRINLVARSSVLDVCDSIKGSRP